MKDKEVKPIKEVTSRNTRRKIKKGTNSEREEELGKTVVLKRKPVAPRLEVPKENKKVVKPEKVEVKAVKVERVEKKETKKEPPKKLNGSNKAPYVLFTVVSILYFAITICLAGYITYKTIAVIRANSSNNTETFVSETMVPDNLVFDNENRSLYETNHVGNGKVITYYFLVLGTLAVSAFLLAMIFSHISDFFSDKRFVNPFDLNNIKVVKKCANLSVSILLISAVSAILQKCLTPFNVSLLQVESMFIISIALICAYIILKRGNELIKE